MDIDSNTEVIFASQEADSRGVFWISNQGGALKKIAPSGGRRENFWGISCEKSRFYAKKIIFFPILGGGGGARRVYAPWIRPWIVILGQGRGTTVKTNSKRRLNLSVDSILHFLCLCGVVLHLYVIYTVNQNI